MQDDLVIYDALSITSKIHSPADFKELLGLGDVNWQCVKGAKGYRQRMYWQGISIHFDGTDDMGIWLEMMGQGCRAFETYGNGDYEALFQLVLWENKDMKITRLDVAFDDHSGLLDMEKLIDDTRSRKYVSRWRKAKITYDIDSLYGYDGASINHGSMSSEIFLRIYDKAAERGLTDGSHWIRVELQLRRDRAKTFIEQGGAIGENFAGVIANYVRYIEPCDDSNRWRWPFKRYWADLLDGAAAIRLYVKPGVDYNLGNLENFVVKQAGNAVSAYIDIFGEKKFLEDIRHRGTAPNPKYDELKERCKRGEA